MLEELRRKSLEASLPTVLLRHRTQQIVLDEARRSLGVMYPTWSRSHETVEVAAMGGIGVLDSSQEPTELFGARCYS